MSATRPIFASRLACPLAKGALAALLWLVAIFPLRAADLNPDDIDSYKFDFGGGVGMSGYLGDANESNLFAKPGFAADLSFRWLASSRFAVRGLFAVASISGDTSDWDNVLPDNAQYKFKSTVFNLEGRAEFNFFPYGFGQTYKRLKRWTPYLSLGVGVGIASCDGSTSFAPVLPIGVGVKYKLSLRWNLAAEFTMKKVFGDHVDGDDLADLYSIKSAFYKNTDWTSALTISISYEFGPRCQVCHRVD